MLKFVFPPPPHSLGNQKDPSVRCSGVVSFTQIPLQDLTYGTFGDHEGLHFLNASSGLGSVYEALNPKPIGYVSLDCSGVVQTGGCSISAKVKPAPEIPDVTADLGFTGLGVRGLPPRRDQVPNNHILPQHLYENS